jgi:hypothetical protein
MDRNGEVLYPGCPVFVHTMGDGLQPVAATVLRILTGDRYLVQLDPTPGGRQRIASLAKALAEQDDRDSAAALRIAAALDLQEPLELHGSRLERIDT